MSEDAPIYQREPANGDRAGAATVLRELLLASPRPDPMLDGTAAWPGTGGAVPRDRYHRALTAACDWLIGHPALELAPYTYAEERGELAKLLDDVPVPRFQGPIEMSLWSRLDLLLTWYRRPIPMLLYCPNCGTQHVDAPDPAKEWTNPPHRSHECQACGHVWRPADVATVGVAEIVTKGARDGSPAPLCRDGATVP